jgi:transposase
LVIDRGLASAENIALIKSRNLHYIVASRQTERDQWLATFADNVAFSEVIRQPSPTNPHQKKTRVDVEFVKGEACNYVLCRSEQRISYRRLKLPTLWPFGDSATAPLVIPSRH